MAFAAMERPRQIDPRQRRAGSPGAGSLVEAAMTDSDRLNLIRTVHTNIYLVMAASTLVLVYAGLSGATGPWLWVALLLLSVESAVFAGYGFKCPLTDLAVRYGARTGHVFDTFLPERATRYTFRVFGSLMALGLLLLALRWLHVLG